MTACCCTAHLLKGAVSGGGGCLHQDFLEIELLVVSDREE